ncbi:MAG: ParA family protein [Chloroflexi bacterium]|nr:ParA family protein [Chloroflexota bacterium]MBV9602083.1 ParA family protein [Chloroflexota bacterium]
MATTLTVLHPKGGVGRSTTVYMLGAELALRGHRVALIDRDQGRHLTRVFDFYPPGLDDLVLGEDPSAIIRIVDTAPEVNGDRAIGYLQEANWALVPVKGPEAGSVLALPLLLDWLEQARGARLLGFLPTMYKSRRGDSRQWLDELERLAATTGTRVFSPIGDLASLATFRLEAHPYAALAAAVEEVLVAAPV